MANDAVKLRDTALAYLQSHNVAVLATGNEKPWAAPVFYASDGFNLYFLSRPESVHGRHIAADPRLAAAVTEDYKLQGLGDWRHIKGIQIEGDAVMLEGDDEVGAAVEQYARKYPFTAPYLKTLTNFPRAVALLERLIRKHDTIAGFDATEENRFYRLTPARLWLVDNSASFEQRLEVPLAG